MDLAVGVNDQMDPPPPPPMPKVEVLEPTADSLVEFQKHESLLLELEAKKRAFLIDVPTIAVQVQSTLRGLGHPVRLFGEDNAAVRDRLRKVLARIEVLNERGALTRGAATIPPPPSRQEDKAVKYSHASPELVAAREYIADHSLRLARQRLQLERRRRLSARKRAPLDMQTGGRFKVDDDEEAASIVKDLDELDHACTELYKSIRNVALEGSQYGDSRPLSAVCTSTTRDDLNFIATGSWSGAIKLFDANSGSMDFLATKSMAHQDRIMGIAMQPLTTAHTEGEAMLATASIDMTAKLWKVKPSKEGDDCDGKEGPSYIIEEAAHLRGHEARLCSVAFHPSGKFLGTTSFDHSWRLWDVETGGAQLLLQDGHGAETYGMGMHPDGSLVATTDFNGVVQVWDLRTGKSICHFLGHAKRVLCAEFHPNGFQLASAGDDGTVKVWDLRRRKQFASIPAHTNLISQLKFAPRSGEYLTSCSFDGTGKVWSTRDWKLLSTLRGHEGKVMGIDIVDMKREAMGIVTCGYDKTLKLWK